MSTSEIFLNYTDIHDVDENERTIVRQCGSHPDMPMGHGIAFRLMYDHLTDSYDSVASKNNHTLSLQRKSV